jgi:hypothetical protein
VAQLTVRLDDEDLAQLQQVAASRGMPIDGLIKNYLSYLLMGGSPIDTHRVPSGSIDHASVAMMGQAFDWLADEPELYSLSDGEPV